ncbi:putative pentatricopeptide repeat-containing protein [Tanacetum coccineum]
MVVIWNPNVRKSVGIVIPKVGYNVFGFGVCPDTSDPKLVKMIVAKIPPMWQVEVFTLSTRVWKSVYTDVPFKSCHFAYGQVFVNGVIYFGAYHLDHGFRSDFVISFDFKSEKFGEVFLLERLVPTPILEVTKVNESLGLLEYYKEGDMTVCGIKNNGEVVMELDDNNYEESRIEIYEPLSGQTTSVGIRGKRHTFYARSYMETLLLLDHSDSIIH